VPPTCKLKQHRIGKVIPDTATLARVYEMFAASDRLAEAFEELKEKLEDESEAPIKVPEALDTQIKKQFEQHPDITWHRALRLIVDPNALEDETDKEDDEEDGEDLSDE
jgi:hypothetical protein